MYISLYNKEIGQEFNTFEILDFLDFNDIKYNIISLSP